jgi:hypothetical protein
MQKPVSCYQSSGRSLCTFSHSRHKTSQQYAELNVSSARTNSLWTILLMSKKMMIMLLTLLFTCLTSCLVSVSSDFSFEWTVTLFHGHNRKSSSHHKMEAIWWSSSHMWHAAASGQQSDIHQARYRTPNKKDVKISTSNQIRDSLYTDFQDMLLLCLPLHHITTTAADGSMSPGN